MTAIFAADLGGDDMEVRHSAPCPPCVFHYHPAAILRGWGPPKPPNRLMTPAA